MLGAGVAGTGVEDGGGEARGDALGVADAPDGAGDAGPHAVTASTSNVNTLRSRGLPMRLTLDARSGRVDVRP